MNEPEFIELLNLYVDHEITPEDAARLEREVTTNVARRRVYRQYCLMQKGCSSLVDEFQERTPDAFWAPRRSPTLSGWSASLGVTGILAAACVAFFFVAHPRSGPAAPAVRNAVAVAASLPAESFGDALQPVVDIHDLSLNSVSPAARPLFAATANDAFAWLNRVQFAPVSRTQLNPSLLKVNAGLPESETRIAADGAAAQDQVENVSFKFQR
jgi:anti-sigma factor RsiW